MEDECKSRQQLLEELKALRSELQDTRQEQERRILEIRQYYDRFRRACLASNDNFGDWDLVSDTMWCGEGMRAVMGVPETFGNVLDWFVRILHPDDREGMTGRLKRFLESNLTWDENEIRVLTKQGVYTDIIFKLFLTRDENGKPRNMIGLAVDNIRRKKMEAELRKSEEKYRTIIESMEDGYYEIDLKGNYTFVNEALCNKSRRSREELLGMNYRTYTSPEQVPRAREMFKHMYETGKPITILDYDVIDKDGTVRTLDVTASPIYDSSGKPVGARGIGRDVTERKRMEEVRKKISERLNHSQKMEAIGTLAGGIAHDFNNILASIMGSAELIRLRSDRPELDTYLDRILKSCERAKYLVNQILTFGQQREADRRDQSQRSDGGYRQVAQGYVAGHH